MSDETMLKCLIAFVLGWLVSRMMGDGFQVGGQNTNGHDIMLWENAVKCGYQQIGILTNGITNINKLCNSTDDCNDNDKSCRTGLYNVLGKANVSLTNAITNMESCVDGSCSNMPIDSCTIGGIGNTASESSGTGIFADMGADNCNNTSHDIGLPRAANPTPEMCKQLVMKDSKEMLQQMLNRHDITKYV